MHSRFVEQLTAANVPVVCLRGTQPQRVAEATAAIEALLRRPFNL
jgi:hypothetical protein